MSFFPSERDFAEKYEQTKMEKHIFNFAEKYEQTKMEKHILNCWVFYSFTCVLYPTWAHSPPPAAVETFRTS